MKTVIIFCLSSDSIYVIIVYNNNISCLYINVYFMLSVCKDYAISIGSRHCYVFRYFIAAVYRFDLYDINICVLLSYMLLYIYKYI